MNNFNLKRQIDELESRLNDRYDNLLEKLHGKEPTDEEIEIHSFKYSPHVNINATDLRLAIDDFAAILKEIKRIAK